MPYRGVQFRYSDADIIDSGECLYLDECGVCGGQGIPEGECDCNGNVLDDCLVCGGDNFSGCVGCTEPNAYNYDEITLNDDEDLATSAAAAVQVGKNCTYPLVVKQVLLNFGAGGMTVYRFYVQLQRFHGPRQCCLW